MAWYKIYQSLIRCNYTICVHFIRPFYVVYSVRIQAFM